MRQTNGIGVQDGTQYGFVNGPESFHGNYREYESKEVSKTDGELGFSFAKSRKDVSHGTSAMDNFDEYIKRRREQAKEENADAEALEEAEKEHAKELAKQLSTEELKQLALMGIDVESAKLSDLRGMVDTMKRAEHKEEMQALMDKIRMPEEVPDDRRFVLTEDDGIYLLRNELPLTKENLFKAHYSGSRVQDAPLADEVFEKMQPQIADIIEQAGYEADDKSFAGARLLLSQNLPVTADTVRLYMDYRSVLGKNIADVDLPLDEEELYAERAEALYDAVRTIPEEVVFSMTEEGKEVTVAAAVHYEKTHDIKPEAYTERKARTEHAESGEPTERTDMPTENTVAPEVSFAMAPSAQAEDARNGQSASEDFAAVTKLRQLEELRLSMTLEAANRLVRKDLNIDTRELAKVVESLRGTEKEMAAYAMRGERIVVTEGSVQMYFETQNAVYGLADASAAVLAAPLRGIPYTLRGLREDATRQAGIQQTGAISASAFETVRRSYEAVGTAPRADMGDRIGKAFSNIEDMLTEMNMPVNEETTRAVRILGYNSLEITEQSIEAVIGYDREVGELINNFYPEAVLSYIKDGVNPMDVPIDELNQTLRARNYNGGVTDAENFATYLRDMEREGVVSQAERESYIGLYRVMHQLAKSGDREAGYLFANGSKLTIRNLISAMRSRKAAGMDVSVQDGFGMTEEVTQIGSRMDAQIEAAFEKQSDSDALPDMAADTVAARVAQADAEVEQYMAEHDIAYTLVNVSAVSEMLRTAGGIYETAQKLMAKLFGFEDEKEQAIDEETENMAQSMLGAEIPIELAPENILEQLRGGAKAEAYYDKLGESLTSLLYQAGARGTVSQQDITLVKTVQAGFRIMGGMARNNRFRLPVQTEAGIRVVNLSVVQGAERGTIAIETRSETYGVLRGRFAVRDGVLSGSMTGDTSEANIWLTRQEAAFSEALAGQGYAGARVRLGSEDVSQAQPDVSEDVEISTNELYQMSVACVKAMAVLISE